MPQAFTERREPIRARASSRTPAIEIEHLVRLSGYLSIQERALLHAVYERGMTATALARSMGQQPSTVRKRIRRAAARLASPMFRQVVQRLGTWPDQRRAIAEAVVLRGRSQRAAAAALGLSIHRVRREIDCIRAACEAATDSSSRFNL